MGIEGLDVALPNQPAAGRRLGRVRVALNRPRGPRREDCCSSAIMARILIVEDHPHLVELFSSRELAQRVRRDDSIAQPKLMLRRAPYWSKPSPRIGCLRQIIFRVLRPRSGTVNPYHAFFDILERQTESSEPAIGKVKVAFSCPIIRSALVIDQRRNHQREGYPLAPSRRPRTPRRRARAGGCAGRLAALRLPRC